MKRIDPIDQLAQAVCYLLTCCENVWSLKYFVILAFGALVTVVFLIHWHKIVPFVGVLLLGFLTIRLDNATILDFLKYALKYFVTSQQEFRRR